MHVSVNDEWFNFNPNFLASVDPCKCWTSSPVPSELRVDPVCLKAAAAGLSTNTRGLIYKTDL